MERFSKGQSFTSIVKRPLLDAGHISNVAQGEIQGQISENELLIGVTQTEGGLERTLLQRFAIRILFQYIAWTPP
jgi:hypothetical protein